MLEGFRPPAVALKTKDEGEAVDRAFEWHSAGALHAQSKEHMEPLLALYLKAARASRTHTPATTACSRKVLERLARDWGNPRVAAIDRKKVEQWRSAMQVRQGNCGRPQMSDASIIAYLWRLSGFLTWLVKERHLRTHPMKEMRIGQNKKTKRERFCTVDERERLLSNPPSDELNWILHLGFFAGLRFGEMLAMQASWWTPREGGGWVLTVQQTPFWKPKDKECRDIEVHPRLRAFVEAHGLAEPFVLAPEKQVWKEAPDYRWNPKRSFHRHAASVGLGWVTYHTLRHSFATHLAGRGARMIEIAQMLGDSLRVTEETYIAYSPVSRSVLAEV
jgi:integrase